MISYIYDEKNHILHVKIYLIIEDIPHKPAEEELRKVLPKILEDYGKMIREGKIKIVNSKEWDVW